MLIVLSHGSHGAVTRAIVSEPRLEYGVALGAGDRAPRLSWKVSSDEPGWAPQRYEATARYADGTTETAIRESSGQVFEPWPFAPLRSRERVAVSVRVGAGTEWSPGSAWAPVEAGLLDQQDWRAHFITPKTFGGMDAAAPTLLTDIDLPEEPVSARLYVTAKGLYEFTINSIQVGTAALTPGWSAYKKRLRYQTYDVTEHLHAGVNSLRAVLGNGWYRGQLVWPGNRSSYGERLALLAQLEVTYSDGSVSTFATDDSWRARESGILFDDLYDGQLRDMRVRDDTSAVTEGVLVLPDDHGAELVAPTGPSVRVTAEIAPMRIFTSPADKLIVDFGQNLVGWVALTVRGAAAGAEVTIRHAEVLEHGELGVRPLRSAKATCTYLMSGLSEETVAPTFTFSGFRYAEISGVDHVAAADIRAVVLGSDLARTGWFESSSPELNQLHSNIVWSMRGNFLDLPTDCPARDERLGWTGDLQVFAPTANFLFDTSGFLAGWLRDLAAEQRADGGIPNVIPDVLREQDPAQAGWGDAATIVPLTLWEAFDDLGLLVRQYPSMLAWVEKVLTITGDRLIWDKGDQFGDWLDPTAPPEDPGRAQAHPGVVATAHFARSTFLVARAARLLGNDRDASHYESQYQRIVEAFNREYVTADGIVLSDCQTVYALAIKWGLLDSEGKAEGASTRLAELVRAAGCRVSTGFLGTPLILDALQMAGHPDLATAMMLQRSSPSWLYAVDMGATTVWERWDSMLPDGSINPGTMTSFNHYAYGAVADWMHRSVAGLAPLEPGYRRVRIRPVVTGDLSSASARFDSAYGEISVAWSLDGAVVTLEVTLPVGVTAEVCLPDGSEALEIGSGSHSFTRALELVSKRENYHAQ